MDTMIPSTQPLSEGQIAKLNQNFIVRKAEVNRNKSPKEILDATGRKQYIDKNIVAKMPKGEGEEAEVFFWKLDCFVNGDELEKEYELRDQKPADFYSLAAVNEADPKFADKYPNGTQWKDENGKWCIATFGCKAPNERYVGVGPRYGDWGTSYWFAGIRK